MQTGFKVSKYIENIIRKYSISENKLYLFIWNSNMAYGITCYKKKHRNAIGVTRVQMGYFL